MQRFIACTIAASTLIVALFAPSIAQAAGRSRYSPYIMTPGGPMLRSQYMLQTMQFVDPAMLALMQQQEQAFLNKGKKPTTPTGNTGVKPTGARTTTGVKTTAGKPATPVKK
jgi:hypothetical protein